MKDRCARFAPISFQKSSHESQRSAPLYLHVVGPPKNISSFRLCPEFDQVETRGGAKVKDKSRAKLHAALPGQVGGGGDDDAWAGCQW